MEKEILSIFDAMVSNKIKVYACRTIRNQYEDETKALQEVQNEKRETLASDALDTAITDPTTLRTEVLNLTGETCKVTCTKTITDVVKKLCTEFNTPKARTPTKAKSLTGLLPVFLRFSSTVVWAL
eukprot:Lankesteria_metandrocarpae@DN5379_c1_g1_i1.p3